MNGETFLQGTTFDNGRLPRLMFGLVPDKLVEIIIADKMWCINEKETVMLISQSRKFKIKKIRNLLLLLVVPFVSCTSQFYIDSHLILQRTGCCLLIHSYLSVSVNTSL